MACQVLEVSPQDKATLINDLKKEFAKQLGETLADCPTSERTGLTPVREIVVGIVKTGVHEIFKDKKPNEEIARAIGEKVGNIIKTSDNKAAILLSLLEDPKFNQTINDIIKNIFIRATFGKEEDVIKNDFLKFVKNTLDDPYPLIKKSTNKTRSL